MKTFDLHEFIVQFIVGAVIGALIGFGLFARADSQYIWSLKAAWAYIGGGAVVGGLLLACTKSTLRHS